MADKIDLLCMYPSFVITKMISHLKTPINAITVDKCVNAGLRDLGYEGETYGALIHEVTGALLSFVNKYFADLQQAGLRFFLKRGGGTKGKKAPQT